MTLLYEHIPADVAISLYDQIPADIATFPGSDMVPFFSPPQKLPELVLRMRGASMSRWYKRKFASLVIRVR